MKAEGAHALAGSGELVDSPSTCSVQVDRPIDGTTLSAAFVRDCLCLHHAPERAAALRTATPSSTAAWQEVRALVRAERLGPLMHRAAGNRGILPPALEVAFRRDYQITAMRNRLLLHQLGTCLRAFAEAGIATIVLKGAALATVIYRDVALRPMIDADLLVHASDRVRACRVLEKLGYTVARMETRRGALLEHESELELRKSGLYATSIDLHWSLFDSPYYQRRIDMEWFWRTAELAPIADQPAQMLGPEAQVLHLCGHLALHHAGHGLLWWHDVAAVLVAHAGRIEWEALLGQARTYDLQLPLRIVLIELAARWGAPVPGEVLAELRARQPSRDEARLFAQLSADRRSAGRRFWSDFAGISSWMERWRFATTNLFPSAAYMRQRYGVQHPWLLLFSYPYRWLRGLRGE